VLSDAIIETPGLTEAAVRRIVGEEIERALLKDPAANKARIIASKGTLDWAYPPLIQASAAAASGMDTSVFFTSYGLNLITKGYADRIQVSPTGNPAMPMPVPMADVFAGLPGMKALATWMLKSRLKSRGVASIQELIDLCRESGVRFVGCEMTLGVLGFKHSDFIEGVEFAGAAAFLSEARWAHLTLFI
jgi:peroxiredoxin family protein